MNSHLCLNGSNSHPQTSLLTPRYCLLSILLGSLIGVSSQQSRTELRAPCPHLLSLLSLLTSAKPQRPSQCHPESSPTPSQPTTEACGHDLQKPTPLPSSTAAISRHQQL